VRLTHVYKYILYTHSVFSATLLLSITALFREPKACEDLQLDISYTKYTILHIPIHLIQINKSCIQICIQNTLYSIQLMHGGWPSIQLRCTLLQYPCVQTDRLL
jgi:hypothetical protein